MAGEQQDVSTRTVHLVRLSGMDGLLLHSLDTQSLQLLVENLTQIHDDRLVNLLPQMGTENLDQRDLERRDLSVQEDTSQIELNLKTNINVGSVDCR